ncbi:MAG: hypothetical protein IKG14_04245 [Clostridia bacterium]|nr:hypothetical protein [Clostridia bacterium]
MESSNNRSDKEIYYNKLMKNKELTDSLYIKLKEELDIEIPKYILDEIYSGGDKNNIIALTNLAISNNSVSEKDAEVFKANLYKYLI